jgi:hypothetical protein
MPVAFESFGVKVIDRAAAAQGCGELYNLKLGRSENSISRAKT